MARKLTVKRAGGIWNQSLAPFNIVLDGDTVGKLNIGQSMNVDISEESHILEIGAMLMKKQMPEPVVIDAGSNNYTVSYYCKPKYGIVFWDRDVVKEGPTMQEHSKRVMSLANRYLKQRDSAAAEELENLLPVSQDFLSHPSTAEQELMMALNNTVPALYYVETRFNPTLAAKYAQTAETYFNAAMKRNEISHVDYNSSKIWRDAMILIRSYCAYGNDDFESALSLASDLPADSVSLALSGSVMTRIAYEANPTYAYPAFNVLSEMDAMLKENSSFDWVYKEDIIRTAYGFLTLLYDDAHKTFPDEGRIPHSVPKALQLSRKVHAMLTDEKQKAWAMEDIVNYMNKL